MRVAVLGNRVSVYLTELPVHSRGRGELVGTAVLGAGASVVLAGRFLAAGGRRLAPVLGVRVGVLAVSAAGRHPVDDRAEHPGVDSGEHVERFLKLRLLRGA